MTLTTNCDCQGYDGRHDEGCPYAEPKKAVTHLVAVYDCAMAWGGREEGGWWYDTGSLIRVVKLFRSEQKAYEYCRKLNTRLNSRAFGPNTGKREYTSVISEGELRASVWENCAPAGFPERRPRYE